MFLVITLVILLSCQHEEPADVSCKSATLGSEFMGRTTGARNFEAPRSFKKCRDIYRALE